jgi:ribosomal protein L12E/L44/L45/RPP1/RPP2
VALTKKRQIVAYPDNSQSHPLFGPPAVFEPGYKTVYDELFSRVTAAVVPTDVFEEMWQRDIVDLSFEILQLRRLKTGLIAANQRRSLIDTLAPLMKDTKADALAKRFVARDAAAVEEVEQALHAAGLSMDSVTARSLVAGLDGFERIERLIASAEARRNAALRELERHRSAFAEMLRRATNEVVDAEFENVSRGAEASPDGMESEEEWADQ